MERELWERCRCLANDLRLRMLTVLEQRPNLSVQAVGQECGCSESVASRHLADMGRCGFLVFKRRGRYLYSDLDRSDRLVGSVLRSLSGDSEDFEPVMKAVTGFTHERRVHIVRVLHEGPLEFSMLCSRCRISIDAMKRHLVKLKKRNFVSLHDDRWQLEELSAGLKKELLDLAVR